MNRVTVIGAGLAGCEAAWQLALREIEVDLIEMKPAKKTSAHTSDAFAELVCSNSMKSMDLSNASGLLKEELGRLGSIIISCAYECRIAAGGALAVDRQAFAESVTKRIKDARNIRIIEAEAQTIPDGDVIVATGPLTTEALSQEIAGLCGGFLNFYDAAAPIVTYESIDMRKAFCASRYGKSDADYINCTLTKQEYLDFWEQLCQANQAQVHGFDDSRVFEACMPVEVLARRGEDALRFGPMKPVGLRDPETGEQSYAVLQLRRDNAPGTLYNLVGFQTHLTFPEQKRVFSMIPALKDAEYIRFGVMHRNTFLDSPRLLDRRYSLRADGRIRFAGQITGVEGYVESCSSGMLAALETAAKFMGAEPVNFPGETAIGALALYISDESIKHFQPMNANYGIISPLGRKIKGKREKNLAISKRSLEIIEDIKSRHTVFGHKGGSGR